MADKISKKLRINVIICIYGFLGSLITNLKSDFQNSNTDKIFWFIEIIRLSYSTNQSENWMQSKNYEHTILTVSPPLKRDP